MSEQKRSELLREYFGNAMQLAYLAEAVADWTETQLALSKCQQDLKSVSAMRRRHRRPSAPRLHAGVRETCCG